MEQEEYADHYKIIQSCHIGRSRVVLGEDLKAEQPYFVANASRGFVGWSYTDCEVSKDYLELYKVFVERQQAALQNLVSERQERHSDGQPYGKDVCKPNSHTLNFTDQILVLNPAYLSPAFRVKEEQLVLAESGFGCFPNKSGTKVFCRDCYTGERFYVPRYEILGVMKKESIPTWAAENAALFRAERKAESRGKERE